MVTNHSLPAEKIALFRSRVRGREDVCPRRFESRKSGSAPAGVNGGVRGVREMTMIQCVESPHRCFLLVTDGVVHRHFSGHDEVGWDAVLAARARRWSSKL